MSWLMVWTSILVAAVAMVGVRLGRIWRRYPEHRFKRFLGWRFDDQGRPDRYYWYEGVTRLEVEDALNDGADGRWAWLYRARTRRMLVVANAASWSLTLYGATDLPWNLGFSDSALSWWALTPVPLWLLVRRSVRLVADAPEELLDERQIQVRDRVDLHSYRGLAAIVSVLAALIIPFDTFGLDGDGGTSLQGHLVVAAAFALIWVTAALPSVVLAWRSPDD